MREEGMSTISRHANSAAEKERSGSLKLTRRDLLREMEAAADERKAANLT